MTLYQNNNQIIFIILAYNGAIRVYFNDVKPRDIDGLRIESLVPLLAFCFQEN